MSPPESRLVPDATYHVSSIEHGAYISVAGYSHPGGGLYWSEFSATLFLPAHLADKAAAMPESSFGATRVTLILTDGRHIYDVYLAGAAEVAKVGQQLISSPQDLSFSMTDISDLK